MTYISLIDYSSSRNLLITVEQDLKTDAEVETMLESAGFKLSECSYMFTPDDPGQTRVSINELIGQHKDRTTAVTINGKVLHLILDKTLPEWEALYGDNQDLWSFGISDFITGAVEVNEEIYYWYDIDGRCYETDKEVNNQV